MSLILKESALQKKHLGSPTKCTIHMKEES